MLSERADMEKLQKRAVKLLVMEGHIFRGIHVILQIIPLAVK